MKYRIKEETTKGGDKTYIVQKKGLNDNYMIYCAPIIGQLILLIELTSYSSIKWYSTIEECKHYINCKFQDIE